MQIRPHDSEDELLELIISGDQLAFLKLFNLYFSPLGQAILGLTKSLPLTQHIVQDAFVKVWLQRKEFTNKSDLREHLMTCCQNDALEFLNKLNREQVPSQEQWHALLNKPGTTTEHLRVIVSKAVENLPIQERRIYQMSKHQGLNGMEIGAIMGMPAETINTLLYTTLKKVRTRLSLHMPPSIAVVLTSTLVLKRVNR
ncbi:RNA polymerase sigma factor, sigma-70 family [Pedobacter westerhofensis]|uniref:RNA polymerase sigma factor, sigma-70 family n=1 Tax=Pedobacter westerhofensis TaxID=425512 RepID=A0A521FU24_9SPHI|nr:RNA polymerase sigma factor [Pedobacter westerhofensis]SMO99699.1 RNA polymerase sigma factor, sigma-70 family [Pedobacter westerhofensis]